MGEVRIQMKDGAPWFCAADVCRILEYQNSRDAVHKHCREKGVANCYTLTDGGKQALTFLDEGNLYRLLT
jgi:prophage antirepressor-like protein